jgi:hypothetical protein
MDDNKENVTIKNAVDELLETAIFKKIEKRNSKIFAQKLAMWLIRYILVVSSMNESLKISLESVLLNLHGRNFKKILEVTEQSFKAVQNDGDKYNNYIW